MVPTVIIGTVTLYLFTYLFLPPRALLPPAPQELWTIPFVQMGKLTLGAGTSGPRAPGRERAGAGLEPGCW